MRGSLRLGSVAVLLAVVGAIATGCGGDDDGDSGGTPASSSEGGSLNVAIVDNPQMQDIADLTPSLFTAKTDIKVNYTVLDEGTLREVTTRDVAAGGRQFDVAMIGMYEAPQFGASGTSSTSPRWRARTRRTTSMT
jgi:sorbitol/mannitol transport system substrate-binding protein